MSRTQSALVDPELERQLAAADEDQAIEAVFTLRAPEDNPVLESGVVQQTVNRIVKSAQAAASQQVRGLNVMPMAQSFALAAPAGVVRAVLESAEIASAMANAQPEELAIKPVPRPRGKSAHRGSERSPKGAS